MKKLKVKSILNSLKLISILFLLVSCTRSILMHSDLIKKEDLCKYYTGVGVKERNNNVKYSYSAEIEFNDKAYNVSGNIIRLSDSVVYINVVSRNLGIEIARLKVSKSGFVFINKLNKEYFIGSYDSLLTDFPLFLNFHVIKGLLLGTIDYNLLGISCDSVRVGIDNNLATYYFNRQYFQRDVVSSIVGKYNNKGELVLFKISSNDHFILTGNYSNFSVQDNTPALKSFSFISPRLNFTCQLQIEKYTRIKGSFIEMRCNENYKPLKLN